MSVEEFRSRFRFVHAASVLVSLFALVAEAVFVLNRISSAAPRPLVEAEEFVQTTEARCGCRCDAGALICGGDVLVETDFVSIEEFIVEIGSLNGTNCLQPLPVVPAEMGPTPTITNCSCRAGPEDILGIEVYVCNVAYAFEPGNVQWVRTTSMMQLVVVAMVLAWNAQYLIVLYYRVLPLAPADSIHVEWTQSWLRKYWDPLNAAALWTIWGQLLTSGLSPFGIAAPFPSLRDFSPAELRQGFGPTGADELLVWLATAAVALVALVLICVIPTSALADNGSDPYVKRDTEPEQSSCHTRVCVSFFLVFSSLGFMIGQPLSFIYGVMATLPFLFLNVNQRWRSSWPIDRPCSLFGPVWDLPPKDARRQEDAMMTVKTLEARLEDRTKLGLDVAARVQCLCRVVHDLQEVHPWRAQSNLEGRLQAVVLRSLRRTLDARSPEVMRQLLRAAKALGYQAPPDDDEEPEEPKASRGCCGRLAGYKQLGVERRGSLARDEAWSGEVHSAMQSGLAAAAELARTLEDEASLRWLGALFAALHPEACQQLSGQATRAATALQTALGDEDCDFAELLRVVAAGAAWQPDSEGYGGNTAVGWALSLPSAQAKPTALQMLQRLPATPSQSSVSLTVLEGDARHVVIEGSRTAAPKAATVGAPELEVPNRGRWFFEATVFGHPQHDYFNSARVGWLQRGRKLHDAESSSGRGEFIRGLDGKSSCSMRAAAFYRKGLSGTLSTSPGRGVVGCALEVDGSSFRAWFALDGCWTTTAEWDSEAEDVVHRCSWVVAAADGPVFPAVSGRLACELIFESARFVYGPPDASFRPVSELVSGSELLSSVRANVVGATFPESGGDPVDAV